MLDAALLRAWPVRRIVQRYQARDCIVYALGVGVGCAADAIDPGDLRFVYERGLKVLPTMALTLGLGDSDFLLDPRTGIDLPSVLHGEAALDLHAPLPAGGMVAGETRLTDVVDLGSGTGALLHYERRITEISTMPQVPQEGGGTLLAVERGSYLLRRNGGFSHETGASVSAPSSASSSATPSASVARAEPGPRAAPDWEFVTRISARAALIYRLSGDLNPLHVDPDAARAIGFERPILHGACTFGSVGRDLLRQVCGDQVARLRHIGVRFSAPVFPGDSLQTRVWRSGPGAAAFETRVAGSGALALGRGSLRFDE
jgi:acyl dehydratase